MNWGTIIARIVLATLAALPPANEATPADLFDSFALHDVHLYIHPNELSRLRRHYGTNTYYPADLVWRGLRVRNVGIRSRGQDSRNPDKLGLRVDFDRYTPGQSFLGLRALTFDNVRQDPAMIREHLAMAMFRRMGLVAPRTAPARVFINNDYQGLYTMLEAVDRTFLTTWFGQDEGYLFEYLWREPLYGQSLGDDLGIYRQYFEPETHQSEPDAALYTPIRALLETVNANGGENRRNEIEELIDLEELVRLVAVEAFLAEDDGILGRHGMNNFLLYRDRGSTRHTLIPWDRDRAFSFLDSSPLQRLDENALVRCALAYDDLQALYLQVLEESVQSALEGGWLAGEIDRLWELSAAAAYADDRKPFSNAEVDEAVAFMHAFALERPRFVLNEIASATAGLAGNGTAVPDSGR